ncbi:MAG: hypothetical protein A3A80_03475 [Candidatus Terrybacteria bacterium RIFCSPLOWO2_01_FULL_44_24]|uniref:Uncharacterized protein n=1 Tax=Candidatus Terrybacteria bacterium RIFCSPHIGHO2_01_FULL_43_35 TaxID=1802361 RepID=A0A1G2PDJ2_9BACT|nr:MAG: hypothetical protein A2828_00395 [Candidatus Terrybacteria bacterium RIFCSPHIGHO2_01_FULL_43_35]OHA49745.1 MAG: hypothetical protein A3B75_01970 [Candidatus Terrybacteria bacterium RIFCSPHIGHO2_02_FULL_43_14]OHA51567.1 MAG: hypothetical protein A3A80_03475 [Candidatus Terrybacteria bacterium RIFCSPLOWO2_01_FULL_44_24]
MKNQLKKDGFTLSEIVLAIAVGLVILVGIGYQVGTKGKIHVSNIENDTTISGDYVVKAKSKTVVHNGVTLTIEGNLMLDGDMACDGGPLNINVKGNAVINKNIECNRADNLTQGNPALGISLVISGSIIFGKDASIVSNGQVQIVDASDKLATTQEALGKLFEEAAQPTGVGPRIGPFLENAASKSNNSSSVYNKNMFTGNDEGHSAFHATNFIKTAFAKGGPEPCVDANGNLVNDCIRLSGKWYVGQGQATPGGVNVPTPPKGVNNIILNFNFGPGKQVQLADFTLSGPDGRKGEDDVNKSCNAIGGKGENAFRLMVLASHITINNFDLFLGNGGNGGDAETIKDCDPGKARGGKGGAAGNFKMVATDDFSISGAFNIHPGKGGKGGQATAKGKDGVDSCPGKKGGDATSTGGEGGDNKKELDVQGGVSGTENINIGEVIGGEGGLAVTQPGKGGNGTGCKCDGGKGGNGTSNGGKGGNSSVKVLGAPGTATGGKGGDADSRGGTGGNGGSCNPTGPGGNGGSGGDAKSKIGNGGSSTTTDGAPGTILNEKGGDGGNGGDGCNEGAGGKGGSGNPLGNDGSPGKNLCLPPSGGDSSTHDCPIGSFFDVFMEICVPNSNQSPPPTNTTPPPSDTPPPASNMTQISAIQYQNKYLPVDQLIQENEAGCGQVHWHAAQGFVRATDCSIVQDPGPLCGYGPVSQYPVMEIDVSTENTCN